MAVLVWLAMLGVDFLLNGALFAAMYQRGDAFLLAPAEAFRRIPLGYLAFLIVAFGTVEITHRVGVTRIGGGIRLGLVLGGVAGTVWGLSLYSIATIDALTALSFAVIWVAIVLIASVVAAAGLTPAGLRRLAIVVVGFDVISVVTVVALQSLGVVPTIRV